MANKEINELTAGTAPDGTELFHGVQGGNSRKFTQNQLSAHIALRSGLPVNLSISASVAANALTVALKGTDGNDPSASNPVYIPFRSATAANGALSVLTLTAAASLVISNGSTMGFSSASAGRLWVVGFNDAGTFRLGLVNCLSGISIMALRDGLYSSTAEGGAGGADSAQVIYTGTAVSSKALTILGFIEWSSGLSSAGAWDIAPTGVQLFEPGIAKPGDIIQKRRTQDGAYSAATTVIPSDNTIPQISEGAQFLSQAISPAFAANLLEVSVSGEFSISAAQGLNSALFRDSSADAIAAIGCDPATANYMVRHNIEHVIKAGATASTTFSFRAGSTAGATVYFNGFGGAARLGGVHNSFIQVEEIMA